MVGHGAIQPMSVKQIVQRAENFEYNPLVPFRHWSRSAGTLLKEAEIYESEGNDQQTYLLLFRHARLILDKLPTHPEARLDGNPSVLQHLRKDVLRNFPKLEALKPRISKRHERYRTLLKERAQAKAAESQSTSKSQRSSADVTHEPSHSKGPLDPALGNGSEALAAGENRDLAIQLAHKEIRRRAIARKATRQAGISEEDEQERRTAGVWAGWEDNLVGNDHGLDQDSLSKQMQDVRLQVSGAKAGTSSNASSRVPPENHGTAFQYPNIPHYKAQRHLELEPLLPGALNTSEVNHTTSPPPLRPPKDHTSHKHDRPLPPRPSKDSVPHPQHPPRPLAIPAQQDLQPATYTFEPAAYLENGTPLRTIWLPPDLRHRFLTIALPNTKANLETCGILCGTLISNALFISKLVIPEQESTSDTCEMLNESDFFDYVDGQDLMVMMPESIAIVCAPSRGDWGAFRLTDPPGMKVVLNCTQSGLFHPHSESNIYTDALRPGHVYEAKGLCFDVVDLRPAS
ncbi:MAG: hypothetical protein Q9208_002518 [Pyrenodesmia sp. 3 TL-2023]